MSWTWPVGLLDPYAVQQASYNLVAAAAVGWSAADAAAMAAAEAQQAARATMAAEGAEQRAAMRQSAEAELARLRAAMVNAHPDREGQGGAAFRKALYVYRRHEPRRPHAVGRAHGRRAPPDPASR
jgi:hypothetical protein